jgi:hypothetical protein
VLSYYYSNMTDHDKKIRTSPPILQVPLLVQM